MILAQGVVPDALLIIESGVVTAAVERPDGWLEVGRMGPGELIGETGIVDQSASLARFSAMTDCMVYRIESKDLEPWLDEHGELRGALAGLVRFRAQARATMIQHKPVDAGPNGFLQWLRKSVTRFQPGNERGPTDKLS